MGTEFTKKQEERFKATRLKELQTEEDEYDALAAYLAEFETEEEEEELILA